MVFVLDDAMLALIVRFVADVDHLRMNDEEFFLAQVAAVKVHAARFPENQRGEKVMEWIEEYAEKYRRDWQRNSVSRNLSDKRCTDCPLIGTNDGSHCEIHSHWVQLLQSYNASEITSRTYVEDTLRLLKLQKANLQVKKRTGC